MYFYYGITHSTLENPEEEIELKVDQKTYVTPPTQSGEQTAVWDRHGYENRMADSGGCWNAGNTINQGWGDEPAAGITVPSYNSTKNSGSSTGNGTASRNSGASAKSSSGTGSSKSASKSKSSRQPPPPPIKKPATKAPGASTVPPTNPAPAPSAPKKDGFGMFVEETQFPSWDD